MNQPDRTAVNELITRATTSRLEEQVALLGDAIDLATDLADIELLKRAAATVETILVSDTRSLFESALHYIHGNAWGAIRRVKHRNTLNVWNWESEEHEREILSLRRAIVHPGFSELPNDLRVRVFTNLGSCFSNIGRTTDALEYYERALDLDPQFGMTLGSKGECLLSYARQHFDPGQRCALAAVAAKVLEEALSMHLETPGAAHGFLESLEIANAWCGGRPKAVLRTLLKKESSATTGEESRFRKWALDHRLFLNPLNDIGTLSVAEYDSLHLPTIVVKAEAGAGFQGFYNQLKQEYAAARWLFYEATQLSAPTPPDSNLNLLDTLDAPVFGIAIEKLKLSMRSAYSLFDKIAVFLVRFFEFPDDKPYFRRVWYAKRVKEVSNGARKAQAGTPPNRQLRSELTNKQNLALRALFWISKDLASEQERQLALEPDARDIADIRNAMEHGYLKVHSEEKWPHSIGDAPADPLAHHVCESELRTKTLRVLKLARSALVHLSLAVHQEEQARAPRDPRLIEAVALSPLGP